MMQKARRSMTLFFGILPSQTWKDLIIERPLLSKRKKDLLTYCDRKHIPYGIDETNFDDHYTRNALRKEITKWTDKKFNAKFLEFKKHNVAHTKLRNTIDRAYHKWREGRWDVKLFQRRNHQLQIYILYRFLVDNNIHKISSAKIKLIQQFLLCANKRGTLRMGRQQILMKDKGYICLKKKLV
jgi:tRNA(Ile)-lysidine synthase TilS/MesJ